jgi:hypothetical protein
VCFVCSCWLDNFNGITVLMKPSANHSDIDDWFRRQMPHLRPTVQALDESIRATIPGLHYAVNWKRPYYGLPELGWIIELAAYDVSVNVVLLGGADFDSPPPLGTTDRGPGTSR